MSSLPMLRETADLVRLFDPATGEELNLSLVAPATLANLRDMIRDAEEEQQLAKRQIDGEVIARMDRDRSWTMRVEGGFEMTAPSPEPKSLYDAAALYADLMEFVDAGTLTIEAVNRAVEQVITFKPRSSGIRALAKGGGPIAEVIAQHETKVEPTRRVTLKRIA